MLILVMLFVMPFPINYNYHVSTKEGGTGIVENAMMKKRGTFLMTVHNRENATWQGTLTWVDKNEKQQFRSALELIKLIESALDEAEGGSHEK